MRKLWCILGGTMMFFMSLCLTARALSSWEEDRIQAQIMALESEVQGRLGIMALYTGSGNTFAYRADERFPLCSTFKAVLVGAVLHRSQTDKDLLHKKLLVPSSLVSHSPFTSEYSGKALSIRQLCAAAITVSDNTATNMLLEFLGGPSALRHFTKGMGDTVFRLDRAEPELNSSLPGDQRDTSSPRAMALFLKNMVLGKNLQEEQRQLLEQWLRQCHTGQERIAAALPAQWTMGHKTGSGDHGTRNDIAIVWPPEGAPIVLTIYLTHSEASAEERDAVIRKAAALLLKIR